MYTHISIMTVMSEKIPSHESEIDLIKSVQTYRELFKKR